MSDYRLESSTTVERKVEIEVTSDDGARRLAFGRVASTYRYSNDRDLPPELTLSILYPVSAGTWEKIRTAVDEAFSCWRAEFAQKEDR